MSDSTVVEPTTPSISIVYKVLKIKNNIPFIFRLAYVTVISGVRIKLPDSMINSFNKGEHVFYFIIVYKNDVRLLMSVQTDAPLFIDGLTVQFNRDMSIRS